MELAIIEAVEAAEAADKQKVTCYVCDKVDKQHDDCATLAMYIY